MSNAYEDALKELFTKPIPKPTTPPAAKPTSPPVVKPTTPVVESTLPPEPELTPLSTDKIKNGLDMLFYIHKYKSLINEANLLKKEVKNVALGYQHKIITAETHIRQKHKYYVNQELVKNIQAFISFSKIKSELFTSEEEPSNSKEYHGIKIDMVQEKTPYSSTNTPEIWLRYLTAAASYYSNLTTTVLKAVQGFLKIPEITKLQEHIRSICDHPPNKFIAKSEAFKVICSGEDGIVDFIYIQDSLD